MTINEVIGEITARLPIENYLNKAPHGGYICPFCGSGTHANHSGAVKIYKRTNTAACHSAECRPAGKKAFKFDVLDAMQKKEGYSKWEAIQEGARILNLTIDDDRTQQKRPQRAGSSTGDKIHTEERERPQTAAEEATRAAEDYRKYYLECRNRLNDPRAISYLSERGISPATASKYYIGFDPAWVSPAVIRAQQAKNSNWRPAPTARIIAPANRNHYATRAISTNAEYSKAQENGGGEMGFFNEGALYDGTEIIFVTEGFFDALSVLETGAAAIALNSANMAADFVRKMEKKPTGATLIISLDNDDGGKRSALEIAEAAERLQISHVEINISGSYKDPNEFLTSDKEGFFAAVERATVKAEEIRAAWKERARQEAATEGTAAEILQDGAADPAEIRQPEEAQPEQGDALTNFFDLVQTEAYRPYETGLPFFDKLLGGGVVRQSLMLLMAAPAAGKTSLAQQIAEAMAKHGRPVCYICLEMAAEQLLAKALSGRLARKGRRMSALQILQGYAWTEEERAAVAAEVEQYRAEILPHLAYNPAGLGADLDKITAYLQKIGAGARAAGKEAPAVILDYMHLVSKPGLDVQELIKKTVMVLKQYAIENNSFALAISATNRNSNSSGQITMASGRDSSNIEYGADYILGLNYYEIDKGEVSPTDVEKVSELIQKPVRRMILRVLKGRLILPGKAAQIYFDAACNTFFDEHEDYWMTAQRPEDVPAFDEQEKEPDLFDMLLKKR